MGIDKDGNFVNAEKGLQGFQPNKRPEVSKPIHDGSVTKEPRLEMYPTEQVTVETLKVGDTFITSSGDRMRTVVKEFGYDEKAEEYTFATYPSSTEFVYEGEIVERIVADDPRTLALRALRFDSTAAMLEALQGLTARDRVSHYELPLEDMVFVSRVLHRETSTPLTADDLNTQQWHDLRRVTKTLVTEDYWRSLPSAPAKDPNATFSACKTPMQLAGAWEAMTSPENLYANGMRSGAKVDRLHDRLSRDYLTRLREIEAAYPFMTGN